MKINFASTPLNGYGQAFVKSPNDPWTLGAICVSALDQSLEGEKHTPTEIYRRGKLAYDIISWEKSNTLASVPEMLPTSDLQMLKNRIGIVFGKHAMLVKAVWDLLEGESYGNERNQRQGTSSAQGLERGSIREDSAS